MILPVRPSRTNHPGLYPHFTPTMSSLWLIILILSSACNDGVSSWYSSPVVLPGNMRTFYAAMHALSCQRYRRKNAFSDGRSRFFNKGIAKKCNMLAVIGFHHQGASMLYRAPQFPNSVGKYRYSKWTL